MNVLQWYFEPPTHPSLRERRWYLVGLYWFPFVGLIHAGVVVVAALVHVAPLFWMNLAFSVPSYIVASLALRLGRERLAFRLSAIEVFAHGAVGVYAVGWSSGLQLPVLAAPLLLGSGARRLERFALAGLAAVELVVLRTFGPPAVVLPPAIVTTLFILTTVTAVGVMAYIVIGLDAAATDLEHALARERDRSEELLRGELAHQVAERSKELGAALARGDADIDPGDLQPGGRFAKRYEIVAALGVGGMGAVYEVQRTTDEARLALKVIRGAVSGETAARFAREAEIGARVRHPNVVSIVDVGISEGIPYLVMELVRGGSLEKQSTRYRDVAWALPILGQIVDGLSALHDAGVVHRDLKPANILLAGGAENPTVKISDFGISRIGAEPAGSSATSTAWQTHMQLTQTGVALGTPLYMAPETGAGAPDASADVFALGVVAFELLSGARPFTLPPAMLAADGRLRVPEFRNANVPAEVSRMIVSCLTQDPALRPRMSDLRSALRDRPGRQAR